MIYATVNDDGTETLLSPEEARRLNKLVGLTDVDQAFIRAMEAGEITGDHSVRGKVFGGSHARLRGIGSDWNTDFGLSPNQRAAVTRSGFTDGCQPWAGDGCR